MNGSVLSLIGSIVLEGVKAWNEERRTRFMDEYHELLTKISKAESDYENWDDYEISTLYEKLEIFLKAYRKEIQNGAQD